MYEAHFGLKEPPFSITPDPRFLFLTRSHRDALAYLQYGIEQRKGLLVLSGEVGVGKTLVIRALLDRLDGSVRTALVMNARLTFNQVLHLALVDFGIKPSGRSKVDLLLTMQDFLLRRHEQGGNTVLIVDEAQNLNGEHLEEIRLLSNLEAPEAKLLQIVLVGQPELRATLSQRSLRQLRQRIPGIFDLTRLPNEAVREYVEYRLQVASDGRVCGLFDPEAIPAITRVSEGIPRLINILCDRALLIAFARGSDRVGQEHVGTAADELEMGTSRSFAQPTAYPAMG